MALKVWLTKLYYDLSPIYRKPMQEYLHDTLEYNGSIGDLITAYTNKYKRDNTMLADIINLHNSHSIGYLGDYYELLDYMQGKIA